MTNPGIRSGGIDLGKGLLFLPIYPIALSLIAPIDLFTGNVERLLLRDVFPAIWLSVLLVGAIQICWTLMLRDRHRAAFATALVVVMFCFPRYPVT